MGKTMPTKVTKKKKNQVDRIEPRFPDRKLMQPMPMPKPIEEKKKK
jgi:hypothetical protein